MYKEKIKEIEKEIIRSGDMKDEYLYWDEETTKKNFDSLLTGYIALLKGVKELLKKAR